MELIELLGGVADPSAPASPSQVAALTRRELTRGLSELRTPRAGYDRPLVLPVCGLGGPLLAAVPVDARARTVEALLDDGPRPLLLVAAAMEALVLAGERGPVTAAAPLTFGFGEAEGALVLGLPWARSGGARFADAELAALQLDERLAGADRLRAVAAALPASAGALVFGGVATTPPLGGRHVLAELEVLVRAGLPAPEAAASTSMAVCAGRGDGGPAATALLDAVLGPVLEDHRPHEDADPSRRMARRILQTLAGKRKWSGGSGAGFHTEVTHLTRGFDRSDRELAGAVVDALLAAGLLVEKPSVGQRHVSLLSRRAGDITALIERGEVPPDLDLP
ncbi:MAG: hypothetical protein JHD16_09065 [Solirubrobacteraceae bacterium]|nr:hypothetical protein [Solirubrobacteraceae bacterium]